MSMSKVKLNLHLTSYTENNSKQIKIRLETEKLLEGNERTKLHGFVVDRDFLVSYQKLQTSKTV